MDREVVPAFEGPAVLIAASYLVSDYKLIFR